MSSLEAFKQKLANLIEGEVRFDAGTIAIYSHDASNYRQVPVGVVMPRDKGDVIETIRLARENSVRILARGGGTSLAGQATNTALVLDFSKYMHRVIEVDADRRTVTVEPGAVQSAVNAALAPHALFFAPDPSTKDRCTIGGMIGNNSCGAHSAAYGKTVDNLEALEVLLYDGTLLRLGPISDPVARVHQFGGRVGEIYRNLLELRDRHGDEVRSGFPKLPRRVSGYNLDQLLPENGFNLARALVGSEGTLAVTLGATLRAVPRPNQLGMVVLGFSDVFLAADQMPWMLAHRPEALEGFDDQLPAIARMKGMAGVRLLPEGRAFLVAELGGDTREIARERGERMIAEAGGVRECVGTAYLANAAEQTAVWAIRESGLGSGAYVAGRPRTWPGAEDAAVPPEKLGRYLRGFDDILTRHSLTAATYYGHFGEGCVHMRVSFDFASPGGIAVFRAAMEEIAELVAQCGGSLSGEHGDGIARSELLPKIFSPRLIEAFGEFKRIFDPGAMMNPGVLTNPYPLDSHLKFKPSYLPVETHFDLAAEGGLAGATLKCVGIGKCRKTDAGTMCPSYMATREEMHSTRGRARILFEALSGTLPGGFTDDCVAEALDLCLSCKSCKSECPSSVDLATYKAEFLSHYYQQRRRPLAAHFFGRIHEFGRIAAAAPSLANALANAPGLRQIAKRILGVHRERSLPRFARQNFRTWFTRRPATEANGTREVILFPDTFNNYFEPEVAIAATAILERAGLRVTLPPVDLCCGRPLYDQGMLEHAKYRLRQSIDTLAPMLERGAYLVGLEPSCILTFRDELPALFPHDAKATLLRDRALLLDEFLFREVPNFALGAIRANVMLHGHCHQKALAGLDAETAILGRAEGLKLTVLDAGCCGMAGPFGYAAAHFEVSKACAGRVLVPAVACSAPDTIVMSDGFSCRAQIRQFCPDRLPLHLAQVLNLAEGSTCRPD